MQSITPAPLKTEFLDHPYLATQESIDLTYRWCDVSNHTLEHTVLINRAFFDLPAPIMVYFAARVLDRFGSGHVITTLAELASLLDRSETTIKRLVRQAKKLGFLRSAEKERGSHVLQLYLPSGMAICAANGISQIGGRIEVTRDLLNHQTLRTLGAEAEALQLQRASRKAARHAAKSRSPKASRSLETPSLNCVGGKSGFARFTRVDPTTTTYGGSQRTIAKRIGRSERTIQRRLSNQRRQRLGLPHLDRTQILKAADIQLTPKQAHFLAKGASKLNIVADSRSNRPVTVQIQQLSDSNSPIIWIYCPNIYDSDLFVKPDRRLSKQLKGLSNQPPQSLRTV